ncbi:hypothetical protein [Paraburkholderia sp. HD33-4]|uniref:hypothetical protein n=1 Tax=Paraburkholderia sp. HD33-4 TaxID=2883242 RepID=UPI001F21CB2E|nr:hypothetical protein [Paraburkholderia sp. HD33-4]
MALLGNAAVLIWNDVIESARDAFYRWHDKEHIPERLALPGFARGRRYRGSGVTEWLTIYEADDVAVLTSPAYLERLNNPTPATRETVQAFRNTARSICKVERSTGSSTGGHVMTMTLPAGFDAVSLFDGKSPRITADTGVLAAHLFIADEAASNIDTREARERAFVVPPRVLLVETSTLEVARQQLNGLLAGIAARERQAVGARAGVYTLEISRLASRNHAT